MTGRVLIVAGSDSGGGAGIQADIKAVTMQGAYAATAITALTAQNTLGVQGVMAVPASFVRQQMESVLDDIGADCIKTGMLLNHDIIDAAADVLETRAPIPVVLDPVMVAKGGARLLKPEAEAALIQRLLPRASLLTPNIPEAEALTGLRITTEEDAHAALKALLNMGPKAVLLKGGHLPGAVLKDRLLTAQGDYHVWEGERIDTVHTHGTGCTLASAISAHLSRGESIVNAVQNARNYVASAIRHAPGFGSGHGPLGHGWILQTV
ncbi:bifunctional hydroxymethylpyrimidine kinase/phosphomethylpyrimidine kinase [bacterium]|nr:bifunctional hydroxymethylpyrimidine kinase/phosphomethylpyrimidine kinase [bacterium]